MFKRICYTIHRMLGTILSILFLMWFLSGFVMIYHTFPRVKPSDCYRIMQALPDSISGNDSILNVISGLKTMKLNLKVIDMQPVYQIITEDSTYYMPEFTSESGAKSFDRLTEYAGLWCDASIEKVDTLTQLDQWIPFGQLKKDMPIYKFYFADKDKHELYVSSKSGEALQFTDKDSRFWAWLGPIPHWIYFTSLRQNTDLWSNTIVVLCVIGLIVCISGIILGIRAYITQYKSKKKLRSPYKKTFYKWHHILGFFFGIFVFTFTFSGMMSLVGIPDWMVKTHDRGLMRKVMSNGSVSLDRYKYDCNEILKNYRESVKSIDWDSFGDIPLYKVTTDTGVVVLNASSENISILNLTEQDVRRRFEKIHGQEVKVSLLTDFDNYYLSRKMESPLPVYKVEVNDADGSVSYVNPQTGSVRYYNNSSRVSKWTYRALHAYSIKGLVDRPVLWNIVMWTTMIGGTLVSFTGLYLGVRYIKRKFRKNKKVTL
ncbi:PepSY domain-containing protein [Dysgonomonas sp.]